MGRVAVLLATGGLAMCGAAGLAAAQGPAASQPDLSEGLRLLEGVHDGVTSFDDPAFYWFCRFVREHAGPSATTAGGRAIIVNWRAVLERPDEFRGRVIGLTGIVRSRRSYEVSNRRDAGTLHQFEIELDDGPMCAAICPTEASRVAPGDCVRVDGYFIKIRRYAKAGGGESSGPLIVVTRMEPIESPGVAKRNSVGAERWWIGAGTGGAAIAWLLLRRRTWTPAVGRRGGRFAPAERESPHDFDWLVDRDERT